MVRRDEGPLDTVGWGPFALFGERKRLREAEKRRTEEINAARKAPAGSYGTKAEAREAVLAAKDEARETALAISAMLQEPSQHLSQLLQSGSLARTTGHLVDLLPTYKDWPTTSEPGSSLRSLLRAEPATTPVSDPDVAKLLRAATDGKLRRPGVNVAGTVMLIINSKGEALLRRTDTLAAQNTALRAEDPTLDVDVAFDRLRSEIKTSTSSE